MIRLAERTIAFRAFPGIACGVMGATVENRCVFDTFQN
jgi:hypothetical protein